MEKKRKLKIFLDFLICIVLVVLIIVVLFDIQSKQKKAKEGQSLAESSLILYEGPSSLKDAAQEDLKNTSETSRDISLMHCTDTQITVNGYDCYVYDTNVNHTRKWVDNYMPPMSRTPIAYFDFEGMAKIEVIVPEIELDQVKISPAAYQIEPEIDKENHKVSFYIEQPDTYTITFNNAPERAVHIFANPIEDDLPDFDSEDVIYIGPGEWDIESIMPEDGQTIYLAGGAVVHGIINGNYVKDVTIMGRGILDGSSFSGWQGKEAYIPLKFDHCKNIAIKDVIVLNSNAWVCQAFDSQDGVIDGIKIISSRPNGDGITLQSCKNYEVSNCFVRSWDDSLVVKNYAGSTENITFSNMQLWTDLAQSMEVGYETNKGNEEGAYISQVIFKDITVLNNFHKPVISIHNGDDASVDNITFENIIVENAQMGSGDGEEMPYLIDFNIAQSSNWSTTRERGTISNITVNGLTVLAGKECSSRISGYDAEHKVSNVVISNMTVLGKKITSLEDGKIEVDAETAENIVLK